MPSTLKNTLPFALIAAGALAAIIVMKPSPAAPTVRGDSGALIAETATYDFGAVPLMGGLVRTRYRVRNAGAEPVSIIKLYTSCMCTTGVVRRGDEVWGPYGMPGHGFEGRMNAVLAPGETTDVEAVFDPAAHGPAGVGPVMREIYLEHSGGAPLVLSFTATVTP